MIGAISKIPEPGSDPEGFQKLARKLRLPKSKLVAQRRIDELIYQIGCLQPLLQDADANTRLRASVEIRALDDSIRTWYLQISNYKAPFRQPKLKKKKKEVREKNLFRPI